jgi:hypothetical protein
MRIVFPESFMSPSSHSSAERWYQIPGPPLGGAGAREAAMSVGAGWYHVPSPAGETSLLATAKHGCSSRSLALE